LKEDSAETAYGERFPGGTMSDEQLNHEDPEVEGHVRRGAVNTDSVDENEDDEVEAHVRKASARMDSPKKF